MKPFRKNVAIAIDGGGIRGIIVTKALSMLENELGQPLHNIFRLTAGTSTGSPMGTNPRLWSLSSAWALVTSPSAGRTAPACAACTPPSRRS